MVMPVFVLTLTALLIGILVAIATPLVCYTGEDSGTVRERIIENLFRVKKWFFISLPVIVILMILTSGVFYTVPEGAEAVVSRLGSIVAKTGPGFHLKVPVLDDVTLMGTGKIRREEFGFRTIKVGPPAQYQDVFPEQSMLTQDGKLVNMEWVIQYRVFDTEKYLLNLARNEDADSITRNWAESSMREVVATKKFDDVLTTSREEIQKEARAIIQKRYESINCGIQVTAVTLQDILPPKQVIDALNDVTTAKSEKDRDILKAEEYYNDIVPKAVGEASRILNDAEAYKDRRVAAARGEASRLTSLKEAYTANPELVKLNIYMEHLKNEWKTAKIIFVDDSAVKLMQLGQFGGITAPAPSVPASPAK